MASDGVEKERKNLIQQWGPEIVIKCCRYWKLHYGDGRWGNCGICRTHPKLTNLAWDDVNND